MKKSHSYNVLSTKECMEPGCTKKLKLRLVETKAARNITHCFKHEPKHRISGHSKRSR